MAGQSGWERVQATRLSRESAGALGAGLILGLLLGLLIGWVWWPVEWQGATTGGTAVTGTGAAGSTAGAPLGSQFETPEAKALYLGAVADAFVYAGSGGETDAAAVAAQRLAALGGDLRAAFNNAIDFYRAQAGGAVRANNLATLALAVGIPVDANAAGTNAAGTNAAGTNAAGAGAAGGQTGGSAAGASVTTSTTSSGSSSNWPLILLFALLLIGGGLFILWLIRQQQDGLQTQTAGGFAEDEEETETTTTTAFTRDTLSTTRSNLTPAASVRSTVDRPQAVQSGAEHGFELDEPDEFSSGATHYGRSEEAEYTGAQTDAQTGGRGPVVGVYNWVDDDQGDEDGEGPDDEGGAEDEGDEQPPIARPTEWPTERPAERQAPSGFVTSVGAAPPFGGAASQSAPAQPAPAQPAPAQPAPPAPRPAGLQPPTPARYDQYTPVEGYTATYYQGRVDFDYAKSIPKPDSNEGYDGEYGIGIPDFGVLDSIDMEKVVAFTVYLFDKSDETQPVTVSRLLLSHYADDHRAEFERAGEGETKRLPPIVAQPSTNFQLEGRQLLLDCLIKQVEYTPDGYFRSATIEIVLKRKG